MKRWLVRFGLATPMWFMFSGAAVGMCIWFAPPSRQFEPATNMKTLLIRDGSTSTLVVEPEFSGTATNFALVMPFPSQPEITEAPENIFIDLEDLTNPEFDFGGPFPLAAEADAGIQSAEVRVVEQRDVGDYTATTLEAGDATALLDWLQQNGYETSEDKIETLDFYIAQNTAFFVALKVNISKADVDANGVLQGKLNPIEFAFQANEPKLPLRLMAGEGSLLTLTVYTIADNILYIPGAEMQFSRKITSSDIKDSPSIEDYDVWKHWLVRNVVQFDPTAVTDDLTLLTTDENLVVDTGDTSIVLNPELLPAASGVLVSDDGEVTYSRPKESPTFFSSGDDEAPLSLWIITAILGVSNIVLLALMSRKHPSESKTNL